MEFGEWHFIYVWDLKRYNPQLAREEAAEACDDGASKAVKDAAEKVAELDAPTR